MILDNLTFHSNREALYGMRSPRITRRLYSLPTPPNSEWGRSTKGVEALAYYAVADFATLDRMPGRSRRRRPLKPQRIARQDGVAGGRRHYLLDCIDYPTFPRFCRGLGGRPFAKHIPTRTPSASRAGSRGEENKWVRG